MDNIFDNDKIWNRSLDEIMSESFGRYAKYIIQDRALPDIRDGLKPVQRRILYAMNDLNIHFDKPYKKSARTVGEVIGKYHPHGDSSIYEAMVRMSQEWKNNIPLLDMQGNKGSIDGDSPAAMRYTECRLSKYGQSLLDDIKKDTVKFIFNFDDSEQEPSILPSLIPNILINGSTGIAAGYATNVPPFNLNEVLEAIIYRIKHKHSSLLDIASIIKGPDFPTGGTIQGIDGILDIYKTGKGKFNIRAKFSEVVRNANKKHKQLIITELPYEVNKASLVKAIDELRLSNKLPGLKEVRDDSDKSGISIMLELDTEKSLDVIKSFLYKNTQLQISYSANIILIKDRKPMQLGILDIIDSYLEHANEIIVKSATFDLNKALSRKEILEGLIIAISKIDLLVNLIKSSNSKDEAKQKLIQTFKINERQAEAVIQLRLYVLTSYDTQKLKDEFNELLLFIKEKEDLINNKNIRSDWLINKLKEYQKCFNVKRKTVIEDQIEEIVIEDTDIVEEKHGIAIVTRDNYIKFIHANDIDDIDLEKLKIKENDIPIEILNLSTLQTLVCFTNKGKCISIPAHKIKFTKQKDNGIHINEIITIDSADKTIAALALSKTSNINTELVVATKKSLIKRMTLSEITIAKNAKTSSYIHLRTDDEVCSVFVAKSNVNELITVTESGFSIRFGLNEIPLVSKVASGVKNIGLKNNDLVASSFPINPEESFIYVGSNRGAKRIYFNDVILSSRAKNGKKILSQVDSNPYIINSAFMISGRQSLNVLEENGKLNSIRASEVPISDVFSRMSKYPGDIDTTILTSIVDLKRNFVNDDLENNFLTQQSKEKTNLNVEETINEYDIERKNIDKNDHSNIANDTSSAKDILHDEVKINNAADVSFIREIEDEIDNVVNDDSLEQNDKLDNTVNDEISESENEIDTLSSDDSEEKIENNIADEESEIEDEIEKNIDDEDNEFEEITNDDEDIFSFADNIDDEPNIAIDDIKNDDDSNEIEIELSNEGNISYNDDTILMQDQEDFVNIDKEENFNLTDDSHKSFVNEEELNNEMDNSTSNYDNDEIINQQKNELENNINDSNSNNEESIDNKTNNQKNNFNENDYSINENIFDTFFDDEDKEQRKYENNKDDDNDEDDIFNIIKNISKDE
ncbi:MAG: DNA topoisomerase IV subunit A [Malacoplasma sp.]